MKPSPPSSRLPRWATGAGLLVLLPVAGWALGRRFAQARCSETATLLGSDPRLAKHAAQTREARGEAVFPLAWPARAPMHAPAPEPLYNAPNPTQRVAFVVAGGLRTFANANAHRSLFWHGLRALGGSVEAIFVVSTDHGWHSDGRDFLRRSHHADRAKIRDAIAAFDPVHVEVHSNADCSNETIARRIACCPAGNPDSRVPQTYPRLQAYWLAASLDVVRARERAVGRPYDWVARVRPDLVLLEPLPVLANLAPTRLYVAAKTFTTSNIWDVFFSAEINQCVGPAWRYYLLFWPPRRNAWCPRTRRLLTHPNV